MDPRIRIMIMETVKLLGVDETQTSKGRIAPEDMSTSYLLSAGYDGKEEKVFLRFYEPQSQQIYLWYDNTGHLPYCISKASPEELRKNRQILEHPGFLHLEEVKKFDALSDKPITVTKIIVSNPLAVGGHPDT